jgi:hypothetical protein
MTRIAAIAIALALLAAGCSGSKNAANSPRPQLRDLQDIGQLRSLFNTRSGEPRLIVLVSPT